MKSDISVRPIHSKSTALPLTMTMMMMMMMMMILFLDAEKGRQFAQAM